MVLYRSLSGKLPFSAESIGGYITEVLTAAPIPLGQEVPADLARAVYRCLAKDPAHRYPSALALVRALAPFAPEAAAHVAARLGTLSPTIVDDETMPPSVSGAETVAITKASRPMDGRGRAAAVVAVVVCGAAALSFFVGRRGQTPAVPAHETRASATEGAATATSTAVIAPAPVGSAVTSAVGTEAIAATTISPSTSAPSATKEGTSRAEGGRSTVVRSNAPAPPPPPTPSGRPPLSRPAVGPLESAL